MTCPEDKNCVERTTIGLGGSVLDSENDFLAEGSIFDAGETIHPGQTIVYANNGDIDHIGGSGHKRNESMTIRTKTKSAKFWEIYNAFKAIGNSTVCYDQLVVNNPCWPAPLNYKSVVITGMEVPDVTHDSTEALINISGVPV